MKSSRSQQTDTTKKTISRYKILIKNESDFVEQKRLYNEACNSTTDTIQSSKISLALRECF